MRPSARTSRISQEEADALILKAVEREAWATSGPKKAKATWLKLPLSVALRMGGASGAAWAVLACLLNLEFRAKERGQPLALPNTALGEWGVSRRQKYRALVELEALGLVSVKLEPRKSPRVVLIW